MIESSFDARTLANMNVALDRVCKRSPLGEQHNIRQRVAHGIIQCAKSGRITLGALTEAGKHALVHPGGVEFAAITAAARPTTLSRPNP